MDQDYAEGLHYSNLHEENISERVDIGSVFLDLISSRTRMHRFLLDMFIQGLAYTFNTVPAGAGVRQELYSMVIFDSYQVVCRCGYPVVQQLVCRVSVDPRCMGE